MTDRIAEIAERYKDDRNAIMFAPCISEDMLFLLSQLAERDKKLKRLQKEVASLAIESIEREKTLAKLEAEVMQLWEAQRWTAVTERLPRQNTNVLTFTPKMAMPIVVDWYNGYYGEDDNEWYEGWNTGRNITHWMPLPAAPEEGAGK